MRARHERRYWRRAVWPTRIVLAGSLVALTGGLLAAHADKAARQVANPARPDGYWIEQIADGLNFPTSIAWLPDGRMLVLERMGGLRIVQDGKLVDRPVGGVPPSFQSDQTDGLRDVAPDPDFASNGLLYILLSEGNYDGRAAAVYRGRLEGNQLTGVTRIFITRDSLPISANTSMPTRLQFLPDKTLLVAVAGIEKKDVAQRLDSHAGKILRINRDGSVPKDNPFVNRSDALPEIWTYGHRAVLGMCRFKDGTLWSVDTGARGGDELNLQRPGANYGWSRVSWSFTYENEGAEAQKQSDDDVDDPKLLWLPSVTPSGLACYEGSAFPQWNHDIFVGHLSGKAIERVRLDARWRPIQRELIALDLDERVRDIKEGPDGLLYFISDSGRGRLMRIRPGSPAPAQLASVAQKREVSRVRAPSRIELGDPVKGKEIFVRRCTSCHALSPHITGGKIGPDLAGFFGQPVGSRPGFGYSNAMKNRQKGGVVWHLTALEMFLSNPDSFVAGSTMPIATEDREERRAIIAFLREAGADGSR